MITGDQELQWAYLLCPTFELSNSEGKPLTNGYIELYIAGTRDKYYAASDFAGTLHPFQIPLDSLGSNIVLVSPDNAYDIYVYNRFGNLVMSRYNVVPTNGAAGGGSSSSNISINSEDGTVVVTESTDPETGVKTFDLSVPCVTGNPSYWTGRGAATMGVTISDTEYHKIDISEHSIRNRNDDITVVNGEFNLKKGVYFWNVTIQLDKYEGHDNTRQRVFIESGYNRGAYTMDMTHDETETISFSGITVADYDDTKQDIKIKSEGESLFKAVLYNVSIHKLNQNILGDSSGGHTYLPGDYIEITEDDVINVTGLTTPEDVEAMIDAAITAQASGDIYTGGDYINIENHVISVTGLQPEGNYLTPEDLEGYATETYVDNSVSSFTTHTEVYESTVTAIQAATGAIPDQLEAGDYITIIDNKINVTGLQEAGDYATHTEVYEAVVTGVQLATSMIPDQLEAGDYISIENNTINVTGLQPEGDYATQADVHEATVTAIEHVTALIPEAQVQSDWTEADSEDPSYIQHKPQEVRLVAGDNINITETATSVVISAADSTEYTEGWGIDINNNTISVVSSIIPSVQLNSNDQVTAINNHTLVGKEYTAGSNIEINNDAISLKDVVNIPSRNEAPEGYILLGNIVHWGHDDYGPGIMIDATMDDYMDSRRYVWFNTSDQGRDERFWGQYDYDREAMAVSGESFISIHEGDITYQRGDFDRTDRVPVIWSCSGMRYDIDRLQEAVSGISDPNIFWAIYGTTTYDEVKAAHTAGKKIVMYDGDGNVVGLTQHDGVGGAIERFYFCWVQKVWQPGGPTLKYAYICKRDGWYRSYTDIQADWNVTNNYYPGYIKNKPSIPVVELNSSDQVTAIDGHILAGGGGSTYTAGQYISIDSNDVIAVTGLAPVSGSDGITVNNNVVSLDTPVEIVAGDNITITVTGASAIFSAQTVGVTEAQVYDATVTAVQTATGWVDSQGYLTEVPSTYATDTEVSEAIASSITDFVTEGQVTALIPESEEVDFEELDITQFAQASAIPTFTEGNCIDITSNAISWETTAGITDIVTVSALPANPVATVIYLIPEN